MSGDRSKCDVGRRPLGPMYIPQALLGTKEELAKFLHCIFQLRANVSEEVTLACASDK